MAELEAATNDRDVAIFLRRVGDGHIEDVRAMLAANSQIVNAVGPHPYWGGHPQALHVSIETQRRDMFDLLLAGGADVNGRNDQYDHWSPLMLAVHWDQPEMRRVLIERDAHVGLVEAMLFEDDALVDDMLRAGASALPEAEPNSGSLLAFARTPFAIDRLLDLGVSPDRKDRWGATPIEAMSRLGTSGRPLVRHMQRRGIKAEPQEYARLGDEEELARLLETSPDVARSDDVLIGAVDFCHHKLVQWLLDRGADANARSSIGSRGTALHSAAWNGDLAMVKLLVAAGADINARDEEHENTPCGWAKVAITVANNPECKGVVEYLSALRDQPPPSSP
jgi:ankyrin repeat protein